MFRASAASSSHRDDCALYLEAAEQHARAHRRECRGAMKASGRVRGRWLRHVGRTNCRNELQV